MAIKINLETSAAELFCCSKWWGDPDLPADMEYPMAPAEDEDGSFEYPLTFVCQIDCEDIAPFDPEGRLPRQGMFYVFAGLDEYLDNFESPWHNGPGPWGKKMVVVKYTKAINMETFRSAILVDDEDQPLTQPALKMSFEACGDGEPCTRLLGRPSLEGVSEDFPDPVNFLQIASGTAGLDFGGGGMLNLVYAPADFAAAKWRLVKARSGAR